MTGPAGPGAPLAAALGALADPGLAAQVASIAQQPYTSERPSLLHFGAAGSHSGRPPGAASGGAGAGRRVVFYALAALLALLVLLSTAPPPPLTGLSPVPARRRAAQVPLRTRLAALGVSVASLVGMLGTGLVGTGRVFEAALASIPSPLPPRVSSVSPLRLLADRANRVTTLAPLIELGTVEQTLSSSHDELVRQEAAVTRLTAQLQRQAAVVAPDPGASAQLQQLVASYRAAAATYQSSLQHEYDIYVEAVQDRSKRDALLASIRTAPPEIQLAVQTNLDAVQAQETQEAMIAAAEAQQAALQPATHSVQPAALPTPTQAPATAVGQSVAESAAAKAAAKAAAHPPCPPPLGSPMGGVISQPFGPSPYSFEPPVTLNGQFYPHFHTGLDIAAELDRPVHAAGPGTVILATSSVNDRGVLVGYGNYVAISHGCGLTTVYGHLDQILVKPGQHLSAADVIGLEGSTGNSTGPHLHFETRRDNYWVDPAVYLSAFIHA